MDQSAVVNLSVEKNGRSYVFSMPGGAPFGEAYDVAHMVLMKIVEMSNNAASSAKRVEASTGETKEEAIKVDSK